FYFAPKILRAMKAKIWLAWKKLNGPADRDLPVKLPLTLPVRLATVFGRENVLGETVAWTAPCISGRSRRIPANLFGALVGTNKEQRFLNRRGDLGDLLASALRFSLKHRFGF